MIVCSCHAVTDRQVRRAAHAGAHTSCEIAEMCGAGASCGGCRETVHELLAEAHGELRRSEPSAGLSGAESESASA